MRVEWLIVAAIAAVLTFAVVIFNRLVRLADGRTIEERQPHMRGGASDPLTRAEIDAKFRSNARLGGWTEGRCEAVLALARDIWGRPRVPSADLRG